MMDEERKWFIGIDWGSQEHVVSLCDDRGKKIGQRKFAHGGVGLSDLIAWVALWQCPHCCWTSCASTA
jgi:hypothetical protein